MTADLMPKAGSAALRWRHEPQLLTFACSGRGVSSCGSNDSAVPVQSATRQGALRASVLATALMLAGCSASEIVQNWTPPPAADLSEPNYRRVVADNVKTMFP